MKQRKYSVRILLFLLLLLLLIAKQSHLFIGPSVSLNYDSLLETIKRKYDSEKNPANKRQWLSMAIESGASRKFLRDRGWEIGKRISASTTKWIKEGKTGEAFVPKGRPNKVFSVLEEVKEFLKKDDVSYIAANRIIRKKMYDAGTENRLTPKKKERSVRYLNMSRDALFTKWKQEHPNAMIKNTKFQELVKKFFPEYKQAKKESDLCHICEQGKNSEKQFQKILRQVCSGNCDRNNQSCTCPINQIQQQIINAHLVVKKICETHRHQKTSQKAAYNKQIEELKVGQAILVLDYKQNIQLKQSQRELGNDWFNKPQRTCFGAVLLYLDRNDQKLKKHPFDILSTNLSHNSLFTITAIEAVLGHEFFISQEFTSLSIWNDGGASLKNKEVLHYLGEFYQQNKVDLQWNVFTEYHGKSVCDTRFSNISSFLKRYSEQKDKVINTDEDLITAIKEGQHSANENRVRKNKAAVLSTQIQLDIPEKEEMTIFKLDNIKQFHSFIFTQQGIQVKVLTSDTFNNLVKYNSKTETRKNKPPKIGTVYIPKTPEQIASSLVATYKKHESQHKFQSGEIQGSKERKKTRQRLLPTKKRRREEEEEDTNSISDEDSQERLTDVAFTRSSKKRKILEENNARELLKVKFPIF